MNCKVKKVVSVGFFYECDWALIIALSNMLIFSEFNIRYNNCISMYKGCISYLFEGVFGYE